MSAAALPPPHATPGLGAMAPSLWADRGCPFAHRVLALARHLGCALELRECEVGGVLPELTRYSPSSRIPLLVHGDLTIGESRVMLEHLAEHYGFAGALPADLPSRTLHRHAMAIADAFLVPRLTRTEPETEPERLEEMLDAIEQATASVAPAPCLLALHLAPVWLRTSWWNAEGAVSQGVKARPALRAWLDAAVELECIQSTAPEREAHIQDLERARDRGLVPWERDDALPSPTLSCTTTTKPRATESAGNDRPRSQS